MSTVRFATTCDRCHKRSEEYTAWPICRECNGDVCYNCVAPNTLTEVDLDNPETAVCKECLSI